MMTGMDLFVFAHLCTFRPRIVSGRWKVPNNYVWTTDE